MLYYWLSVSSYYSSSVLDSKILIAPYQTKSNKTKQRWQLCFKCFQSIIQANNHQRCLHEYVYQQFWIKTGSKTPVKTCFCQSGRNPGRNMFLAETCQHCIHIPSRWADGPLVVSKPNGLHSGVLFCKVHPIVWSRTFVNAEVFI